MYRIVGLSLKDAIKNQEDVITKGNKAKPLSIKAEIPGKGIQPATLLILHLAPPAYGVNTFEGRLEADRGYPVRGTIPVGGGDAQWEMDMSDRGD